MYKDIQGYIHWIQHVSLLEIYRDIQRYTVIYSDILICIQSFKFSLYFLFVCGVCFFLSVFVFLGVIPAMIFTASLSPSPQNAGNMHHSKSHARNFSAGTFDQGILDDLGQYPSMTPRRPMYKTRYALNVIW